jgi:hypothetical protein
MLKKRTMTAASLKLHNDANSNFPNAAPYTLENYTGG